MEANKSNSPQKETDFLVYKGNSFPRILRLAWTLIIVFSLFYLITWFIPDLLNDLQKLKTLDGR